MSHPQGEAYNSDWGKAILILTTILKTEAEGIWLPGVTLLSLVGSFLLGLGRCFLRGRMSAYLSTFLVDMVQEAICACLAMALGLALQGCR